MSTHRIDDPADPRVRAFVGLPERGRPETIIVEGEIAVVRALASGCPIDAVLTTPSHRARLVPMVADSVPIFVAEPAVVRQIAGFDFHRGCIAAMPRPRTPETLSWQALGGAGIIVVAERLADPANLGALIRNARAFGVAAVVVGPGADPWSRRAIRAAMGLGFCLPIIESRALAATVADLRAEADTRVVAAVVSPDAAPLHRYRPGPRTVLLVGNEGAGLSPPLGALADDAVTIPLAPGVDSLNVAAATAVLLWALAPRR